MMKGKKSARPDVGASKRAKEPRPTFQSGPHSYFQSTTSAPQGQELHIADFLSHGADHGLHLSDLVRLTCLPERVVRRQIAAERKRGIMILADNKSGYFLPGTPEELRRFSRSMGHRASEIMAVARMAENAFAEALGQGVMEGWTDG